MTQDLFGRTPPKTISAHDLKGNSYQVSSVLVEKIRVSVYGILTDVSGSLLLQRHPVAEKFALPGGGVDIGETVIEALVREFKEETNLDIEVGQLLDVCDDYFAHRGQYCQTVMIFYAVVSRDGKLISQNGEDVAETKFISIDQVREDIIQPIHWPIIKKHYLDRFSKPTITTKPPIFPPVSPINQVSLVKGRFRGIGK